MLVSVSRFLRAVRLVNNRSLGIYKSTEKTEQLIIYFVDASDLLPQFAIKLFSFPNQISEIEK